MFELHNISLVSKKYSTSEIRTLMINELADSIAKPKVYIYTGDNIIEQFGQISSFSLADCSVSVDLWSYTDEYLDINDKLVCEIFTAVENKYINATNIKGEVAFTDEVTDKSILLILMPREEYEKKNDCKNEA